MTELQRYLAEEVAEDHADGIITRREAVRRLGLLGVTGVTASTLLTAAQAPAATKKKKPALARATAGSWAPIASAPITFPGPRGQLMGAFAGAARPKGGVLVIHENRGLTDHIRNVAGRYAASGYSALALDLLSEEGGTGAFPGEAEVQAALSAIAPGRFVADMRAALTELKRRVGRKKVGATGFCFGGGMVWLLLTSGDRRLSAAAPYYGPFPQGGSFGKSKAAVLGVYAGQDTRVNATQAAAQSALKAANLPHEILTFTEAGHAFFNETGPRFNAPAAEEAWRRTIAWFDRYLKAEPRRR